MAVVVMHVTTILVQSQTLVWHALDFCYLVLFLFRLLEVVEEVTDHVFEYFKYTNSDTLSSREAMLVWLQPLLVDSNDNKFIGYVLICKYDCKYK